ncbi:MAG: 1,4-dihydroxy-2-naphthoate polyprenyltransferase [Nocardioidaceae bacterium]|nr:1,4-dihydroxy-2-naphthoate polyprenyltransferase [Nocardioidaceae bacterium]
MAGVRAWVAGARPRTLPAAVSPVLVGSGAAAAADGFELAPALLALVVAVSLQVGANYANDYSDGVRGTDAGRVGPLRLVGSGVATPTAVRTAAVVTLGIGAVAGIGLASISSWWLVAVGAVALAAAWTYTGGPSPYGYRALGEVAVFVFFGLVAVLGTTYAQLDTVTAVSVAGAIGIGALACAILVANNLRDIPTDAASGKRTLAVVLGDRPTRALYVTLVAVATGSLIWLAYLAPQSLLGAVFLLPAARGVDAVVRGASGRALVTVLHDAGLAELVYAVGVTAGLVLHG